MTREEIKNKIFEHFKSQVAWAEANPNQMQQYQMGQVYSLFPHGNGPHWEVAKIHSVAREIVQELINIGYIYPGTAGDFNSGYPWLTVTELGKHAFKEENWLPYDPEGYVKTLKTKVPSIDDVTLTYIGEAVAAYHRRHLLSATITLGVASENLMLSLIEAYTDSITDAARKARLEKNTKEKFISTQYKEFKKEFVNDVRSLPKELQDNWETYLDGIFNFIRLNRNDAGHPTGKKLDAKVVYANLQIFSEYADYVTKLTAHFA